MLFLKILGSFFEQLFGCQNGDLRLVAAEVFGVEGEDLANTVSLHGGDEARVVSVFTRDLVLGDQPLPVLMQGGRVRDKGRELLKVLEVLGGLAGAHPQAVFIAWARGHDPEFPLGLGCDEEFLTPLEAEFDGLLGHFVLRVIAPGQAAKDIGVNQDGHGVRCPSIVYGFAVGINRRPGSSGNGGGPGAGPAKPFFPGMRQHWCVLFGGLVEDTGGNRGLVRAGSAGFRFEPGVGSGRDLNCKRHGKMPRNKVPEPLISRLTRNGREGQVVTHKVHKVIV